MLKDYNWVNRTQFVSGDGYRDIDVNIVKGTITVAPPPGGGGGCGDVNRDGRLTLLDVAEALNCIYNGAGDCGAISSPASVVKLLNLLFNSGPVPLLPPVDC